MSLKNWLLLFLLAFLWGGSFFFVEIALESLTPLTIVFLRVSLAACILFFICQYKGYSLRHKSSFWWRMMILGLLQAALPFSLIVWGQKYITGSVAAILNATTPIFTVLVAHFATQDERLSLNKLIGVLLGFIGICVLMSPTIEDGFSVSSFGQLAVLGAAVSYSSAGVWGKQFKHNKAIINTTAMLICASLILLPLIFIFEDPFALQPSYTSLLSICGIASLSTALAFIIFFTILSSAGATNVVLVTFLAPISAMLLNMTILGERLHWLSVFGMLIIFASLIFGQMRFFRTFVQVRSE